MEIREPEVDIYCQRYVNEDILEALGWNLEAVRASFGDDFIEKMGRLMLQYGMTDERSVSMFLMTCTHECGRGMAKLEERVDFSGASYTVNTRAQA